MTLEGVDVMRSRLRELLDVIVGSEVTALHDHDLHAVGGRKGLARAPEVACASFCALSA